MNVALIVASSLFGLYLGRFWWACALLAVASLGMALYEASFNATGWATAFMVVALLDSVRAEQKYRRWVAS